MNSNPSHDIQRLLELASVAGAETLYFDPKSLILEENVANKCLYLILEGEAGLFKHLDNDASTLVDTLTSGAFLGLISFTSDLPTFTHAKAITAVKALRLSYEIFEQLTREQSEFSLIMQRLFASNLGDRYRRMVHLNLDIASLTEALKQERNELKSTIEDLARTRNQLIHKEKLATMGQLLAGIAHEINNPIAALLRNVEFLSEQLPPALKLNVDKHTAALAAQLCQEGIASDFPSSELVRERMHQLEKDYPSMKRSLMRRLSQIDDSALTHLTPLLKTLERKSQHSEDSSLSIEEALSFYELGIALRASTASAERISRLIQSLKSYGRQDAGERERVDLRNCITDTLLVLNNRLKNYKIQRTTDALPLVYCCPGEINQILTNLLVNACDATELGGSIGITSQFNAEAKTVCITVEDSGQGIPGAILERIFEPNFTTKNGRGEFGLGLGLAISRDIALKHGGSLTAGNRNEGGAVFTLTLPVL